MICGRINSYYYGMKYSSSWLLWGNWKPFIAYDETASVATTMYDDDGDIISVINIERVRFWVLWIRAQFSVSITLGCCRILTHATVEIITASFSFLKTCMPV